MARASYQKPTFRIGDKPLTGPVVKKNHKTVLVCVSSQPFVPTRKKPEGRKLLRPVY